MCLLRPNEQANNCNHEECKQVPMHNRPLCGYNINSTSKPTNISISTNFTQQLQNQTKPAFQLVQIPDNMGMQQSNCPRETSNGALNESFDDEEVFTLNKKKIKVSSSAENKQINLAPDFQSKNIAFNPSCQQFPTANFGDKMMFNTPGLNNILLNNTQSTNETKPNSYQILHINQPLFMPMMQNGQGNNTMAQTVPMNQTMTINQNMAFLPYQQNSQSPFQNFAQNIKIKPNMSFESSTNMYMPQASSTDDNTPKDNSSFNIEEFMKSLQKNVVDLLCSQNKMLIDLKEKNELVQDTLACLINEVNSLKQTVKQNSSSFKIKTEPVSLLPFQMIETSREVATQESLLNVLYGQSQDFHYNIVFKNELPLPLYRERNFKFSVILTDKEGKIVKNLNRIPLTLAIYTSENPPKFVDANTSGNKILKGMIDRDIVDGVATFDKIQIKEVTSHFRNGWVFFVVCPKITAGVTGFIAGGNGLAVNPSQIRPLVLEKVVVKAKRAKEKDQGDDDTEDNRIFEPDQ